MSMSVALVLGMMMLAEEPTATPPKRVEEKDQLICKREVPVGSLIASRKVCRTRAEWDKAAMDGQCEARRLYQLGVGQARLEC